MRPEEMTLNIRFDKALWQKFKTVAVARGITLKDLLHEAVRKSLVPR
jgi:predicted DNA-binding ribbon-helix-helix protein